MTGSGMAFGLCVVFFIIALFIGYVFNDPVKARSNGPNDELAIFSLGCAFCAVFCLVVGAFAKLFGC